MFLSFDSQKDHLYGIETKRILHGNPGHYKETLFKSGHDFREQK